VNSRTLALINQMERIVGTPKELDYNEMVKAVEKKCKIKFRGYGRTKKQDDNNEGVYLDFWHVVLATHDEIVNPCSIELDLVKILLHQKHIAPWFEPALIKAYGEVVAKKELALNVSKLDAENDPKWRLDIIYKIMKTHPEHVSSDMKMNVYINW
jgi:hypothetical protein